MDPLDDGGRPNLICFAMASNYFNIFLTSDSFDARHSRAYVLYLKKEKDNCVEQINVTVMTIEYIMALFNERRAFLSASFNASHRINMHNNLCGIYMKCSIAEEAQRRETIGRSKHLLQTIV